RSGRSYRGNRVSPGRRLTFSSLCGRMTTFSPVLFRLKSDFLPITKSSSGE
ncbi:hypothetical protein NDU88_000258, partial [Pleurodeles waltl]